MYHSQIDLIATFTIHGTASTLTTGLEKFCNTC